MNKILTCSVLCSIFIHAYLTTWTPIQAPQIDQIVMGAPQTFLLLVLFSISPNFPKIDWQIWKSRFPKIPLSDCLLLHSTLTFSKQNYDSRMNTSQIEISDLNISRVSLVAVVLLLLPKPSFCFGLTKFTLLKQKMNCLATGLSTRSPRIRWELFYYFCKKIEELN